MSKYLLNLFSKFPSRKFWFLKCQIWIIPLYHLSKFPSSKLYLGLKCQNWIIPLYHHRICKCQILEQKMALWIVIKRCLRYLWNSRNYIPINLITSRVQRKIKFERHTTSIFFLRRVISLFQNPYFLYVS